MAIFCKKSLLNYSKESFTIACSGGVDSIAISHLLHYHKPTIFHYNHNLRPQNDLMEASVKELCKKFDLKLITSHASNYLSSGMDKGSEANARAGRLLAMQSLIKGKLVFCHHLDDCVESYFMNFLNGHPEYMPIPERTIFGDTEVIRPFCLTTKESLIQYAKKNNLMEFVVEDETNADLKIRRNWVRHVMLPEMYKHKNLRTIVKRKFYNETK